MNTLRCQLTALLMAASLLGSSFAYGDTSTNGTDSSKIKLILSNRTIENGCMKYAYTYTTGNLIIEPEYCDSLDYGDGCGYTTACNPARTWDIIRPQGTDTYNLTIKLTDDTSDPFYEDSCGQFIQCTVTSQSCPSGVCILDVSMDDHGQGSGSHEQSINTPQVHGSFDPHFINCTIINKAVSNNEDPNSERLLNLGGYDTPKLCAIPDNPSLPKEPVGPDAS